MSILGLSNFQPKSPPIFLNIRAGEVGVCVCVQWLEAKKYGSITFFDIWTWKENYTILSFLLCIT